MEIIQENRLARPNTLPPGQLSWQLAAWWIDCQSFQDIWFPSCSPGELLASQTLQLAAPQALQLGWGLPGVTEIKLFCWNLLWLGSGSIFILDTLKCSQCFSSLDNINISRLSKQKLPKFAVSQWELSFVGDAGFPLRKWYFLYQMKLKKAEKQSGFLVRKLYHFLTMLVVERPLDFREWRKSEAYWELIH